MPALSAVPWRWLLSFLALLALLALSACDGERGAAVQGKGAGKAGPSASVDSLAGGKTQPPCAKPDPRSLRELLGSARVE